jgi:hypothetical protein
VKIAAIARHHRILIIGKQNLTTDKTLITLIYTDQKGD